VADALGLTDAELKLLLWTIAAALLWLAAVGIVHLLRRPAEPRMGARTLELGPEPPAVAGYLVNDFRVNRAAMPATLVDLAARDVLEIEQRGQGVFYVRLRQAHGAQLNEYERRVMDHLRRRASAGVVPAQALTTGRADEAEAWWRRFEREVVADAKARGLSRDALDHRVFAVLTAAAAVPAVLAWALDELRAGLAVMLGAFFILGWVRARHPQRETEAGLEAGGRWLGVRAALAENEEFARHSPFTVELWERLLAYGIALGVAPGAAGPLAMGTESDRRAWTSYGGRWREVRIRYPWVWPIAWGRHPLIAFAVGAGMVVLPLLLLRAGLWAALTDVGGIAGLFALLPLGVLTAGGALMALGLRDLWSTAEVSGPILRLRVFGDEDHRRFYIAIDDGASSEIRAFRVSPARYAGLSQGEAVTARVTSHFRHMQAITRAPG
jgi:hypothetical protein